eukprot:CAMPEP_0173383382 /NCGR_PEP_ID=MMETSP1356-20130122/5952_1 /TAXON_ID=77927 ORGANISM="Hemiselmis virescens, Strain PCC157" /NCGR_SAMPLE_ID=MMETSP1356 /ASSEMBLY_ACC=CAM_ASM_000847 /LENGTH=45 /DNA_ID= /DNA_START= /DNA_END= /DNA_ORIENTATION=
MTTSSTSDSPPSPHEATTPPTPLLSSLPHIIAADSRGAELGGCLV